MTLTLFLGLLVALSAVSSLLTEAIKVFFENQKKNPSANLIALIDAIVVGCGGTICSYIFLAIPFTISNIAAIVCMIFCIAIGSMVGYDKVVQLIKQLGNTKGE